MALTKVDSGLVNQLASANLPAGSVLQVVQATATTQNSTTASTYTAGPLSATITPKSANSKIVVLTSGYFRLSASSVSIVSTIYRNGSTDLFSAFNYGGYYYYGPTAGATEAVMPMNAIDSPGTTSATTYTIYFKRMDAAGTASYGNSSIASTMTLLEIAQ